MADLNFGVKQLPTMSVADRIAQVLLSDRIYLSLNHWHRVGRWPRIGAPRTHNERLLHRLLFGSTDLESRIDKAQARETVRELLGDNYVPYRYLLTDNPRLPWTDLPERFVVSATHGSGMTMVIGDKASLDKAEAEEIMTSWLCSSYGRRKRERIYDGLQPGLLVEENLAGPGGTPPEDYKFFCFSGEPYCVQVDVDRFGDASRTFYDMNWNVLPFNLNKHKQAPAQPRPRMFDAMNQVAAQLSRGFDFVRVDLYEINGERIVFGEWTFLPGGGSSPFEPDAMDWELGNMWK